MSLRLLCLPFAGAGASFFYPWCEYDVDGVEVIPVQLPGRERRLADPLYTDVHEAADGLLPDVLADVSGTTGGIALFGHSLGAVLAYELARRLSETGAEVRMLVVSGSPGPGSERHQRAGDLGDVEFLARVEEFAGYRHSAFDDPELQEMLLPVLRADVTMHERYRPRTGAGLTAPVVALRAAGDELVTPAETAAWRSVTSGDFTQLEVPGGHMYVTTDGRSVLDLIGSFHRTGGEPCTSTAA